MQGFRRISVGRPVLMSLAMLLSCNGLSGTARAQSSSQVSPTVSVPLTITSSLLDAAESGSAYVSSLQAVGGTSQRTWVLKGGTLPPGVTLSNAGVISGVPQASGTFNFTVLVLDTSVPMQAQVKTVSLTVKANSLAISSPSLPAAQIGTAYSTQLSASGGRPAYHWLLRSGRLPSGLTLSSAGTITGTPTATGSSTFSVLVTDSSAPIKTQSATLTLAVAASPLTIGAINLTAGQAGTAYSASLQASGGTSPYSWTLRSGALPSGLSLSTSGVISGTPRAAATSSFTVQVQDGGSPVQTVTASGSLTIAAAPTSTANLNTWYVRPDGGTRYQATVMVNGADEGFPSGQCDGHSDAAYPGSGVNQHCAFKDIRSLWSDGTYAHSATDYPAWGWVIKGGDTVILRGSIADGVSYRIGWPSASSGYDAQQGPWLGFNGDPYDSFMPTIPSGTAGHPTRILGANYQACSAQTARTQIHGGYGVYFVLNMAGVSNADVECLDVTDFSDCSTGGGATSRCDRSVGTLSDEANTGIVWSNTSTNDTVTNVRVHGLAGDGMNGPTGDGVVMTGLDIIGNPGAGWDADNGSVGVGKTIVRNFNISWNGCSEEYPIRDTLPYFQCTDDSSLGYGDGFGTATQESTGWQMVFDQGVVSYNTQDGLDALHLHGSGSSMTITRVLAYGNMGQQIKIGGSSGTADNNIIVTNCNALRYAIPGTPSGYNSKLSDFCRAADAGVLLTTSNGAMTRFRNNTIYSAASTAVEVGCDDTVCNGTANIDYRNNIFVGFLNNPNDGYTGSYYSGTNNYSNPIYDGTGGWVFGNPGSYFANNITYHPKSNWTCPATAEVNAQCNVDPKLADETWHNYGYPDATPTSSSPALHSGAVLPDLTVDFNGTTRGNPPSIGAIEH